MMSSNLATSCYIFCVWTPNRIPQSAAILRLFWTFSTASSSMSFMCFGHPPKTQSLGTQTDKKNADVLWNCDTRTGPNWPNSWKTWIFRFGSCMSVSSGNLEFASPCRSDLHDMDAIVIYYMEPGAMTLSWHLSKMWKKPCCHSDNRLSCYLTIIQRSKGIVQLHLVPVCRIWWPSCQRKPHMENQNILPTSTTGKIFLPEATRGWSSHATLVSLSACIYKWPTTDLRL